MLPVRSRRWSRRQFAQAASLASLGLVAGCGRLPYSAPPAKRLARVGFLKQPPIENVEDFRQGMRDLGYVEGGDFALDLRYAEREAQLLAGAAELVSIPVD